MKFHVRRKPILTALTLGLIAGAVPSWPVPYDQINTMETTILIGWVGLTIVAAIVTRILTPLPLKPAALTVTAGFLAAMVLRIIVECTIDPTDHNLWPFEIVWGAMIGLPSAFAGSFLARFFTRNA